MRSIYIKNTNIEDLQRVLLMFKGHKIIEMCKSHGKLIDVNEARDDLNKMADNVSVDFPLLSRETQTNIERGIRMAAEFIFNLAPAVIESED